MTREEAYKDLEVFAKPYRTIDKIYSHFESRTCESYKWYDGSHKCNTNNSIAYGNEGRLYPEDGCIADWEKKDEKGK